MKLYHYSDKLFTVLKTRAAQGRVSLTELNQAKEDAKDKGSPGSYMEHISFFVDPVPLDIIGNLFKGKNNFWKNGKKIYEYVVEVDSLEHDILFSLVESPIDINEIDNTDWIDTDEFLLQFMRRKNKRKLASGETGKGLDKLKKQIALYIGKTKHYYIAASKREDFDDNITKYAASVPHLMLYPKSGEIKIESHKEVVIGKVQHIDNLSISKW